MKFFSLVLSSSLLLAGIAFARPADTTTAPVVVPEVKIPTPNPSFVTTTAKPVTNEDLCAVSHSPAKAQVKEAFKAFKTAFTYMLGAIINANPTHDELQEAAKWQLGQTEEIIKTAKQALKLDVSEIRQKWYKLRLRWLSFKIAVSKKLLEQGLPSWPWLGKVVQWLKEKRDQLVKAWNDFKTKLGSWFGSGTTTPAPTTPPTTTDPTKTPAAEVLKLKVDEKVVVSLSTEELKAEIKKEAPAAEGPLDPAAVTAAANKSPMAKTNPIVPSTPLIKANDQVVSDEVLKKLGLDIQLDAAKIDVILEDIDTRKLC
jgi:hypothetical protein